MSGVREWDRSSGERPGAGSGPAPVGGTERLTAGSAVVAVAPVSDVHLLPDLIATFAAIPGVARVELDAFTDGEVLLTVTVGHPVLLAQEIGRALAGRVRSCTPAGPGGRIVVDARPPVVPEPPAPEEPAPPVGDQAGAAAGGDAAPAGTGPTADGEPGAGRAAGPGDGPASAASGGDPAGAAWETAGPGPSAPGFGGPGPGTASGGPRGSSGRPGSSSSSGPRPSSGAPRGSSTGPGASSTGPGASSSGPGAFSTGPGGASSAGPGASSAGPRASSTGPDASSAGPGAASAGARGSSSGPRASAAGAPDLRVVNAALAGAIDDTPGLSVLVFDAELRIRSVAGLDPAAADGAILIGRPVVHAFALVARRPLAAALAAALQGEERTLALPDEHGEPRLQATCRPAGPGLPGGVCVVRDLEAQSGGTLLIEAQRAFEITFRHSPIGQGLLSRTGRWLRVNGALAELLGRPADSLVGAEAVEAMHPDDRDGERERLHRLVDGTDDHYVVGTRFVHVDGHVVRTHTRMTRITDEDGVARGFVAQVVDAAAWRRFRGG